MDPSAIGPADFAARLGDPAWRASLAASYAVENGSLLPLTRAVHEAATHATTTADDLRELVTVLLADDLEWVLDSLILNEHMPEDVLLSLARDGHCLGALGHRGRPRSLLVAMVALHQYPEAILSLAIELYRDPSVPVIELAAFVEAHRDHEWMLRALAGCDPSDDAKLRCYESLLDAPVGADAVVFHGAHRMSSPAWTAEQLADWLDRHDDTELLLKLLRTAASSPDKHRVVAARCASRANREEIGVELSRRARVEEATYTGLAPARARSLFESGDVEVLLALARNQATPRPLLEEMSTFRVARGARAIRGAARATLRSVGRPPAGPRRR